VKNLTFVLIVVFLWLKSLLKMLEIHDYFVDFPRNYSYFLLDEPGVLELYKQLTCSETQAQLYHFRLHAGQEVDIVLEGPAGDIIPS
jgi:hypothetical protein